MKCPVCSGYSTLRHRCSWCGAELVRKSYRERLIDRFPDFDGTPSWFDQYIRLVRIVAGKSENGSRVIPMGDEVQS